jgi:hypothetical protein
MGRYLHIEEDVRPEWVYQLFKQTTSAGARLKQRLSTGTVDIVIYEWDMVWNRAILTLGHNPIG